MSAGHYYNSLKRIDKDINYSGFDITKAYVSYTETFWKKEYEI